MTQGGFNPKVAAHLLDNATGQRAVNTKVYAGDLRGWYKSKAVTPAFSTIANGETIYKILDQSNDDRWIVWDSTVWAARSPLLDETQPPGSNIFYTENLTLKKTNATLAGPVLGITIMPSPNVPNRMFPLSSSNTAEM